jgi:hypothetical protein
MVVIWRVAWCYKNDESKRCKVLSARVNEERKLKDGLFTTNHVVHIADLLKKEAKVQLLEVYDEVTLAE